MAIATVALGARRLARPGDVPALSRLCRTASTAIAKWLNPLSA
ncbi:hypothetical protein ACFQS7_03505 [Dankookia sp. GCM10030260]